MTLEDIIEALNKYVEGRKLNDESCARTIGYFVLHKSITPAPTFKSYKVIEYTLWVVNGKEKYRFFTKKFTTRISIGLKEEIIKGFEMEFLTDLLKVLFDAKSSVNSDRTILDDIIYGEYHGYSNE